MNSSEFLMQARPIRATCQSLVTVTVETCRTSAVSSMLMPPKKCPRVKVKELSRASFLNPSNSTGLKPDRLQEIKKAVTLRDWRAVEGVLARTVFATEQMADRPGTTVDPRTVHLNPGQIRVIIDEKSAYVVAPPTRISGQPVYIQVAGLLTRAQITALNQGLKTAGWQPQGSSGERTPKAAGLNQVRYAGDNGLAAKELADALNATGIVPGNRISAVQTPGIGPGNLEVWISR